jgi:hypothetical protein
LGHGGDGEEENENHVFIVRLKFGVEAVLA